MAGLYPDVPGPRMAYHRDGSAGFLTNGTSTVTALTSGQMNILNNESSDNIGSLSGQAMGVVFPELRDLVGMLTDIRNSGVSSVQTSVDTTTGLDGTWVALGGATNGTKTGASARTIVSVSRTGIKGWRVWPVDSGKIGYGFHLYGTPTAGQTRYLMFTTTAGVEVTGAYFDFADDPRGGPVEDKQFKIKNGHGTLTANQIVMSVAALTVKSPTQVDDYTFSSDGTTFTATLNIGDLAPGASSGTLYVRRTTPITAALGVEYGTFLAIATSWT